MLAIPAVLSCSANTPPGAQKFAVTAGVPYAASASEPRLANLRMLTNGGENAEAYFSGDETKLIFQRTRPPELPCDQMFTLDLRSGAETLVSTGKGRTTCGYFYPNDDRSFTTRMPKLQANLRGRPRMHKLDNARPRPHLLLRIHARVRRRDASLRGDARHLCEKQGGPAEGACAQMHQMKIVGQAIDRGIHVHGRYHDAIVQSQSA